MCTDLSIAADIVKQALPPELLQKIDLTSMSLTDKSFISKRLRRIESDLVYKAVIDGHEGYIYLLLEHQSSEDSMLAFRKLEYNVSLMRQHLKQKHKKLPIIINICLYHGERSPYPYSSSVFDCFAEPELAKIWMFQPFHLIDLTVIPDAQIEQQGKAALLEYLFKHCRDAEFSRNIKSWVALLKRLSLEAYFESVLYYLAHACGDQDQVDQLFKNIIQALPEEEPVIMTYGQQLIQRGRHQGIQEGKQEEKGSIAKKLLLKGVLPAEVAELLDLPLSKVTALQCNLS